MSDLPNIHGTALVLGDRGILVTGPSGSGKTTLALALVGHFCTHGRFARLVAMVAPGGMLLVGPPNRSDSGSSSRSDE